MKFELEKGIRYLLKNNHFIEVQSINGNRAECKVFFPDGQLRYDSITYYSDTGRYCRGNHDPNHEFHVVTMEKEEKTIQTKPLKEGDEHTKDADGWTLNHFRKAVAESGLFKW